jgi:hypothetical protein
MLRIPAGRRHPTASLGIAVAMAMWAAAGSAEAVPQDSRPPNSGTPRDLRRPIDQGLADRNQLGTSLRSLPQSIDAGRSFGRLYVDPRRPDRFLRRQGGLSAVFPKSVYVGEGSDGIPIVPPGTVFEIGWNDPAPAASPAVSERLRRSSVPEARVPPGENRLDSKAFLVPAPRWGENGNAEASKSPSIPRPSAGTAGYGDPLAAFEASSRVSAAVRPRLLRDRDYRVRRLGELFGRALARAGGD